MEFSIFGFRCVRNLSQLPFGIDIDVMKRKYSYFFGVVYASQVDVPGCETQTRQVSLIELIGGIDTVFSNFKDNTRKEIRKIERISEVKLESDDKRFSAIYGCYKQFELSRNWKPAMKSEMKQYIHFTASYENEVIAGISCYGENQILRVAKIFSIRNTNDESKYSNAIVGSASRSVVYEICKYGMTKGYKFVDLGGINFSDPLKIGISQFKESFGGKRVDVTVYRSMSVTFFYFKKILSLFHKDIT